VDKTVQVSEEDKQDEWVVQTQKSHRGHDVKLTCNGQLVFDYDYNGKTICSVRHVLTASCSSCVDLNYLKM